MTSFLEYHLLPGVQGLGESPGSLATSPDPSLISACVSPNLSPLGAYPHPWSLTFLFLIGGPQAPHPGVCVG